MKAWEDEGTAAKLGLDGALGSVPAKLNVNGSSLACGHPSPHRRRITASLAKMLRAKADETGQVARGLISVCRRRPGRRRHPRSPPVSTAHTPSRRI